MSIFKKSILALSLFLTGSVAIQSSAFAGFDRPGFDRPSFDRPGFDQPRDRPLYQLQQAVVNLEMRVNELERRLNLVTQPQPMPLPGMNRGWSCTITDTRFGNRYYGQGRDQMEAATQAQRNCVQAAGDYCRTAPICTPNP